MLNENIHLSEGNIKSKNTDDTFFLTWSLPSKITCPYRTELCEKKCFAKKNENFDGVRNSRHRNFEETLKDTFIKDMIEIIEYQLQRKITRNKKIILRIHTSGDFYSEEYLIKWIRIAQWFKHNDNILFQAYTKSMPLLWDYVCGEMEPDFIDNNEAKVAIEKTNIHFVWSIWRDTPQKYTILAEILGLQTFAALPKDEIPTAVSSGAFLCNGDCGHCKECYTGKSKSIVIPYH